MISFIFLSLLLSMNHASGQSCSPLTETIGTVVTVSTVNQLKAAINQANASGGNMTILIADGTYQIASPSWFPYITASNVIIRSLSGQRDAVVLTGGGMRPTASTEDIFLIAGANITIADMTLGECGNHAIQTTGSNADGLRIHNLRIYNTYEQMIKGASGPGGDGADNGVVECCLFEYTAGIGPQYYIGGIDIHQGRNWLVRDNTFKNIRSPDASLAEHAIHFWEGSADAIVERNIIIHCDRGIGFGLGSSTNSGGIIRNNFVYTSRDVGIGLESSPNSKILNNTVYTTNYFNSIEYRFATTTGVEIINNLTNKNIAARNGASGTKSNNIENAQSSWFIDPEQGDLHLSEKFSPIVNQGLSLSDVTDDIDGQTRPNESGPDIGADEWYPIQLKTSIILQGAYDPTLHMMNNKLFSQIPLTSPYAEEPLTIDDLPTATVDWVLIQLRANDGTSVIKNKSALLLTDGRLIDPANHDEILVFDISAGRYYLVIQHRNHLSVMSSVTLPLSSTTIVDYDFTTGPDKFFGIGGAVQLQSDQWGLWAGNGNGKDDCFINIIDYEVWFLSAQNGQSGYLHTDYNLDGQVTSMDYVLWFNNEYYGATSQVP